MMKATFLALALLLCHTLLSAQDTHIRTFLGKEQVNLADSARLYKTLRQNTPIEPEFTYEPHFAIVGSNGKFYFSTGARLRFTTSFDWGNPIDNPNAMNVSAIPLVRSGNRHMFQMTAGKSQLYFNIIGFPNTGNQVGLFVSLGLDADANNSYRVKAGQVYMRYRNIQCGYAESMYNDRTASLYSINDAPPCAAGSHGSVQINYQRCLGKHFSFGIGVEMPNVSCSLFMDDDDDPEDVRTFVKGTYQHMPDIPFYVKYAWNDESHIRLSGVVRRITYYNYEALDNSNRMGWGLKLTSKVAVGNFDILGVAHGGRAIANYMSGSTDCELDLVPDGEAEDIGILQPTHSLGFVGGVQYNISRKAFVSAQYSWMHHYIRKYDCSATTTYDMQTRWANSVNVNAVYRISDLFSTGIEYVYAQRVRTSGVNMHNNRIFGMFMMNF